MTIKALVYGGVKIGSFGPPKAHHTFDGVHLQLTGSTFTGTAWERAGISLEMSQADALDLAMALFAAAQEHTDHGQRALPVFVQKLQRRLEKKRGKS